MAHKDSFPVSDGLKCLPNASFLEKDFPQALQANPRSPLMIKKTFTNVISCASSSHVFLRMKRHTQHQGRNMAFRQYGIYNET